MTTVAVVASVFIVSTSVFIVVVVVVVSLLLVTRVKKTVCSNEQCSQQSEHTPNILLDGSISPTTRCQFLKMVRKLSLKWHMLYVRLEYTNNTQIKNKAFQALFFSCELFVCLLNII